MLDIKRRINTVLTNISYSTAPTIAKVRLGRCGVIKIEILTYR